MEGRSSYDKFRAVRFFGSLDGLRALSIIGVVWFHCWWGTPYYKRLVTLPVLRQGEYGVHMFYVISGFLITTLLLRERDRFGRISLRDFYIRRSLRIWPLYYATVALYVFAVLWFEHNPDRARSFFHYLPSFLTYTYTWFISAQWPPGIFNLSSTLATEEQFYVIWPVVLRFVRGPWPPLMMAALICLRTATGYGFLGPVLPPGWLPTQIVLSVAIPICLGVLLAHALHSPKYFQIFYFILGRKWTGPVALVFLALCLIPARPPFWLAWTSTLALVGACVVREDHGLEAVLQFRPLAFIGVVSYGMYLLNSLSIHLVHAGLNRVGVQHPVIVFPAGLGVTVAVAYLSYQYFESPFLALKKKRFSPMDDSKSQPATPAVAAAPQVIPAHPAAS